MMSVLDRSINDFLGDYLSAALVVIPEGNEPPEILNILKDRYSIMIRNPVRPSCQSQNQSKKSVAAA